MAAALARPLAALPQAGEAPGIGFLYFASKDSATSTGRIAAFLDGMHRLGYAPGLNFILQDRYANGDLTLAAQHAGELVGMKVKLIVVSGGQAVRAVRNVSREMPIVTTVGADPVRGGLAATLSRPGGNVTGLYDSSIELMGKQLALLRAVVPGIVRVAVLTNPSNSGHASRYEVLTGLAKKSGVRLQSLRCSTRDDIEAAFNEMARGQVQGFIVLGDTFFVAEFGHIGSLALKHGIASIALTHEYAEHGGLMTYGEDITDNFRLAAGYVDKILKGAKPGELPFARTDKVVLAINSRTARALKVAVPTELLLRADKVID